VKEPKQELRVIVTGDSKIGERIHAVVASAKERFHQQAAGIAIEPACASF
jgi:hypothetical protein